MAANNTADAIRAAEFRLYFPNLLLHDGLQSWKVPLEAAAAHVSQFRPSIEKYRPDWDPKDLEAMKRRLLSRG
jgi:hypothetical protein